MADATDLIVLSTQSEISGVNGVKIGESLTGHADANAELRPVFENNNRQSVETRRLPPKHRFRRCMEKASSRPQTARKAKGKSKKAKVKNRLLSVLPFTFLLLP